MNKYHKVLNNILEKGEFQNNKKGSVKALLNQSIQLNALDLLTIFEEHPIARKKLKKELELFVDGEVFVDKYKENGITWWDYCGNTLINSYPTYLRHLPTLVNRINKEKSNSKNYVLHLGSNDVASVQHPCLSLIQFQIQNNELVLTAYQRSSDANLGLPADIYHLYLISKEIDVPLKSITLYLGNVHIYESNIKATNNILAGSTSEKFELNV